MTYVTEKLFSLPGLDSTSLGEPQKINPRNIPSYLEELGMGENVRVYFVDEEYNNDIPKKRRSKIREAIGASIDKIVFCQMLMKQHDFILSMEFDPGKETGPYLFRLYSEELDHVGVVRINLEAPEIMERVGDIRIKAVMSLE